MMRTWLYIALWLVALACESPSVAPTTPPSRPPPPPLESCAGGLLCEAQTPVAGWRVPQPCQAQHLGQRVVTCWMPELEWQRVVEFFQSRYPHAALDGPTLRIAGHAPPPSTPSSQPQRTAPLLMAHKRTRGVELVLLAGDQVDTPRSATETERASDASPRRAP